ncbi:MAG: squalene--hopene cyclase [Desulfobacteraceae bacterium]|nr:squalene--hopene cyclase [Desulfobacteraceae bacterium]
MKSFSRKSGIAAQTAEVEEAWGNLAGDAGEAVAVEGEAPLRSEPQSRPAQARRASIRSSWTRQIEETIRKSCDYFYKVQYPDGFWWAELESNVTITSEYVMLMRLLGIAIPEKQKSIINYLHAQQNENGSWGLYLGDGGDISTTVEAYFALKMMGEDQGAAPMAKAREYIIERGGIEACRGFTKMFLALFDQYDWDKVPSMPVELILLPSSLYFNIYEFSSWARGTAVPLSIVLSIRPKMTIPEQFRVPELYAPVTEKRFASGIHKLFFLFDRVAKKIERKPIMSLRRKAIEQAKNWILAHQEKSGDWAGIQPPMLWSLLALHYLGYPLTHDVMVRGLKALNDFCIEDGIGLRMQSCVSPVWDTALTALAMLEAGVPPQDPVLDKSAQWLMSQQILTGGDWQVKNSCRPGGWAFEFSNSHYPDVDDSAVVLNALKRFPCERCPGLESTMLRGLEWCISMQSTNGGWAAFDRDNGMEILNRIPFADQEAMIDPPTADVTGRMLEAMGNFGYDREHPVAQKAIRFVKGLQEEDGSWWGRWGVNYIYGTWSVLRGLASIGEDIDSRYIQQALNWLKYVQNPDGGWGETCDSYKYPELRGQGPSTASQTAWAIMGLLAGGEENSQEVSKGIQYLVRTQQADGTWDEIWFTGTGFPKHFYIRYHNYRNCFPLMALGQYLQKLREKTATRE